MPSHLLDFCKYSYLHGYWDLHGYQISDCFHHYDASLFVCLFQGWDGYRGLPRVHHYYLGFTLIRHLRIYIIFIIVNSFLFYRALTANHFLRGKKSSANHFLRGRKSSANHFLRGRKFDRYARAAAVNHLFRGKKHDGDLRHSSLIKGEYLK